MAKLFICTVQDLTFTSVYDCSKATPKLKHCQALASKTEFEFHDEVLMLVNATMASYVHLTKIFAQGRGQGI